MSADIHTKMHNDGHLDESETVEPMSAERVLADRVRELERTVLRLWDALGTRDTIGMAKGILMVREHCDPDRAFDILRRASNRTNRRVADIAAELVASNGG